METTENIFELNYKSEKNDYNKLKSILLQILLIPSLILFGSYQNPDKAKIDYNDFIVIGLYDTENIKSLENNDLNSQIYHLVISFYENRDYEPAWLNGYTFNKQFVRYINLLDSAKYFGFPADFFNATEIKSSFNEIKQSGRNTNFIQKAIELEFATTFSAFKYMIFVNQGISAYDTSEHFLNFIDTLPLYLDKSLKENALTNNIKALQPDFVEHQKLIVSLSYFIDLQLSLRYTTPAFIDDKLLAKSLYYTGITSHPQFDSTNTKADALFKLQGIYGLRKDSLLNRPTHKVLVDLIDQRYYQACLNVNRLRKLNQTGNNYLFVNIPSFKLHVIESKQIKEVFNVVVGKKQTPTPVLSSSIEKVVANPFWTVPKSIANNEMLNKIRKDSTYLKKHGYYIINNYEETVDESLINWNDSDPLGNKYWIRQTNSRANALGQVKFLFPNEYSVYLHDTPSKSLFKNQYRAYSHGCVRLENPDKLAQYLTDKFNAEKVDMKSLISQSEHQVIDLTQKIDIHIQYITSLGNENNEIEFYNDIYDLDKKELSSVFQGQTQI